MKRSLLISKIEKSNQKPTKKRRRPNKKLVTTLETLADALPDVADMEEAVNGPGLVTQMQKARRTKSLRTRPGSMKRKEKVEKAERDRFGMNLAQLAKADEAGSGNKALTGLEALKRHIASQMETSGE